ncbi:MAG: hypothetical protein E7Z63_05205 [Thermoplasmata archaeon]|nr:hypothetical protein [Thermoplasmata archaeon]
MKVTIISVRILDGDYLANALNKLSDESHPLIAEAYDYGSIDSDPKTLTKVLKGLDDTNFFVIWVSGNLEYFKNSAMMLKKAKLLNIPTFVFNMNRERADEQRDTFPYSDREYDLLYDYALLGGQSNLRSMGLWMLNKFESEKNDLPNPEKPPAQGVYVPGCPDVSFETHIK